MNPIKRFFKSIRDYRWGTASGGGNAGGTPANTGIRARESILRSLKPNEAYELCIAVNRAVNAISGNLSKASRRIFTRDGREVVGGPAFEWVHRPNPHMDGTKFIRTLLDWYNIYGELAVWNRPLNGSIESAVLCPSNLFYRTGRIYNSRSEVGVWKYWWYDGKSEEIPDSQLLFSAMFSPRDPIRGQSPLVTGSVEVGTLHWSGRYNQSFFQNNAVPSHILQLGEGVSRKERDDFTRRYLEEFNAYNHNSHKVMVISGPEVKIHTLDQPFQDGAFMDLRNQMLQQIAMLYGVPPIEMGIMDKSRFDTAPEERKLFMESTLMPQADMLTAAIQTQVFDRYFLSSGVQTRSAKMSKAVSARFDQVRGETSGSLIFLLDVDTLPIANAVKANTAERAIKWRQAFGATLKETADFFGIELEDRPEREDAYVLATERNITRPERNIEVVAAQAKAEAALDPGGNGQAEGEKSASRSRIKRAIHRMRRMSMSACDTGSVWTLADAKTGFPELEARVRLEVKPMIQSKDRDAVKRYFDNISGDVLP